MLAGFSFGSFVASGAVARLWSTRPAEKIVLVGVAALAHPAFLIEVEAIAVV